MATPTLTLLNAGGLTDGVLANADSTTNWTTLTTLETDIKVQGTGSVSGVYRADNTQGYYTAASAPVTAAGKVLRGWVMTNNLPYMAAYASDPYKLLCYDGSTTEYKALFGSDNYPGGWFYFWQDMDDFTTLTLANVRRWGTEAGHAANAKNVVNTWMDVLRYMDGYVVTGGTSGDKVGIANVASSDLTAAYGIVLDQYGIYFSTGTVQIGSGSTTTYFEMDSQVWVFRAMPGALTITAGLYTISATGSGCTCVIKNSVIKANGTTDATRVYLDFSNADATVEFTSNLVNRGGTITFTDGQTVTGNTFRSCKQITQGGVTFTGNLVIDGVDTASMAVDDLDVVTDNTFISDGSNHAVDLGTISANTSLTWDNLLSGYATGTTGDPITEDDTSNAAILVNVGSGFKLTLNLATGATIPSVKNTGTGTVAVVASYAHVLTGLELNTEVTYVTAGTSTVLYHVEAATTSDGDGKYKTTYTHAGGATVDILIHHYQYLPDISNIYGLTLPTADASAKVSMFIDPNYSNP